MDKPYICTAPESGDALRVISGDLGNAGYLIQMLDLLLPVYEPEKHGPAAGLNLIQACIAVGNKKIGLRLCDAVERVQRWSRQQSLLVVLSLLGRYAISWWALIERRRSTREITL